MGEFYWRVKVGEESKVADYIAPPYMLSMEQSLGDIIWSHAVYVPYDEIVEAFALENLPKPKGIAPNQPAPYEGTFGGMMGMAAAFFIALLAMQIVSSKHAANQVIYHRQVQAPATYRGQLLVTDPIALTGGTSNVLLWAKSPVTNNWVEVDTTLVNDATQETEDATLPIEYYYGSDSDGAWSEGGQATDVVFSAVPDGQYHLQVEPDAGVFLQGQPVDLEIAVVRDKPLWSNFWIAFLLLMAYPLCALIRRWRFETRRWSNSDYAPATYRSSSSDVDGDVTASSFSTSGSINLGPKAILHGLVWGTLIILYIIYG